MNTSEAELDDPVRSMEAAPRRAYALGRQDAIERLTTHLDSTEAGSEPPALPAPADVPPRGRRLIAHRRAVARRVPRLDRALRLKNNFARGGVLEHIYMRNCTVGEVGESVLSVDFTYEEGNKGSFTPVVRTPTPCARSSSAATRPTCACNWSSPPGTSPARTPPAASGPPRPAPTSPPARSAPRARSRWSTPVRSTPTRASARTCSAPSPACWSTSRRRPRSPPGSCGPPCSTRAPTSRRGGGS